MGFPNNFRHAETVPDTLVGSAILFFEAGSSLTHILSILAAIFGNDLLGWSGISQNPQMALMTAPSVRLLTFDRSVELNISLSPFELFAQGNSLEVCNSADKAALNTAGIHSLAVNTNAVMLGQA